MVTRLHFSDGLDGRNIHPRWHDDSDSSDSPTRSQRSPPQHRWLRRLGRWRRRLGLRLGTAGRSGVDRQHPSRAGAGRSTGSIPPRCTAWATPRRSSAGRSRDSRRPIGPTSSPSAAWSGIERTPDPARQLLRPESIRASVRRRSAGWVSSGSISISSTGRTRRELPSRIRGRQWCAWSRRGRFARPVSPTSSVELLERCEAIRHVDSLQPPFSLIRRQAAESEIPWCAAHETGVIVLQPDAIGPADRALLGRRGCESLAPDDWRRRVARLQAAQAGRNLALRDALRPIAERHDTTVSAVAIAWTLAWPGVTGGHRGRAVARAGGRLDRRCRRSSSRSPIWTRSPGRRSDRRRRRAGAAADRRREGVGIHHITAIAGDPQRNLDFYAGVLGLRLVKLTVNFDDPRDLSLLLWRRDRPSRLDPHVLSLAHGRSGRQGTGQASTVGLAIAPGSLGFWIERLIGQNVKYRGTDPPLRGAGARLRRSGWAAARAGRD